MYVYSFFRSNEFSSEHRTVYLVHFITVLTIRRSLGHVGACADSFTSLSTNRIVHCWLECPVIGGCMHKLHYVIKSLTPTIPGRAATFAICLTAGRKPPIPTQYKNAISNLLYQWVANTHTKRKGKREKGAMEYPLFLLCV